MNLGDLICMGLVAVMALFAIYKFVLHPNF
jgi:hypothetical protein